MHLYKDVSYILVDFFNVGFPINIVSTSLLLCIHHNQVPRVAVVMGHLSWLSCCHVALVLLGWMGLFGNGLIFLPATFAPQKGMNWAKFNLFWTFWALYLFWGGKWIFKFCESLEGFTINIPQSFSKMISESFVVREKLERENPVSFECSWVLVEWGWVRLSLVECGWVCEELPLWSVLLQSTFSLLFDRVRTFYRYFFLPFLVLYLNWDFLGSATLNL